MRSAFDLNNPFNKNLYVIFTIAVSSIISAFVVGLVVWLIHRSRQAGIVERLRLREEETIRLQHELTALRAELSAMLDSHRHGTVGECRVIEVLSDHEQCGCEH